jgi:hypothetical protein
MNDDGIPCGRPQCPNWMPEEEEGEWACSYCEAVYCSQQCLEKDKEAHLARCARYQEHQTGGDEVELARLYGRCFGGRCTISARGNSAELVPCPMCNAPLFCGSAECMAEGLPRHYLQCVQWKRHKTYQGMQPEYTSRSVLSRLWVQLERFPGVLRRLADRCAEGEQKSHCSGVMVLAEDTLADVCQALNTTGRDEADAFKFVTLQQLLELDRGVFQDLLTLKAAAMSERHSTVIVCVVYDKGGKMEATPRILQVRDKKEEIGV